MSGSRRDLLRARAEAEAARSRLGATLGELQERLNPRSLLRGAWGDIRERGDQAAGEALDLARSRPAATAGVVAAVAVVLLRHPLGRAAAKLFFAKQETESADDKLNPVETSKPAARPRRRTAPTDTGE